MVTIRLSVVGKRNNPVYRVVVIDHQRKNNGKALAVLGMWHKATNEVKIDKKAIAKWQENGAIVSPAVKKLMTK